MSAQFGYQPNYGPTQPMPQYGIPSGGQPTMPGQGVNLGAPISPGSAINPYGPINWNPVAGDPAQPQRYLASPATTKDHWNGSSVQVPDQAATYRVNWENPIQKYFGNIAGPTPQDPNNPLLNRGTNHFSPTNAAQLQQFFAAMTPQQMQQFTSHMPQLNQAFSNAAQAYANLYANPTYTQGSGPQRPETGWAGIQHAVYRSQTGHEAYRPGTRTSQQENADWLQASYNTLTNRLNDAYLL